jgi:hypothetical protein
MTISLVWGDPELQPVMATEEWVLMFLLMKEVKIQHQEE